MFSRFAALSLAGLALSVTSVLAQDTCESYGVDFQNGGSYFINTNSNADFTCVTQFSGCANDTASIMLVDPSGDGYECTDVEQLPELTSELSTCPIEKDQMTSGEWEIIVIGNNGPSPNDPIAFVRTFEITAGPQSTVTAYPTVTYNVTTTPTAFATNTSTVFTTQTIKPTTTIVVPAKTVFYTSTPSPVTTTSVTTVTRTFKAWTHTRTVVTTTITPSCTVPPKQSYPDPPCNHWPKNIPLPHGLNIPILKARSDVRDSPADVKAIRARFEAIKARNAAKNAADVAKKPMVKRDADAPVVTTTVTSPVYNTTITLTAAVSTVYNLTITTDTIRTTLPPTTIHSGVERTTITAPTPTKTVYKVTYTSITITKTNTAVLTYKTTVTPAALATSCKKAGGHFGLGWNQWSN